MRRRYALVAGGGTAGHVLPALAVAEVLRSRHGSDGVEVVGSARGLEATLLAGGDLPVTLLSGRGIQRRWTARAVLANVGAVAGLGWAVVRALGLVASRRPSVVVSVGGYASVPSAVAAVVLGVPLVLVNVDAVPGAANRLMGRFARASAVAFPGTPLPRAVVTGAPLRDQVVGVDRDAEARREARAALGLPEVGLVVAAFGGSLGARRINQAVIELALRWRGRSDVAIYHVVGRRDLDWARQAWAGAAAGQSDAWKGFGGTRAEAGAKDRAVDRAEERPEEGEEDGARYVQVDYEEHMERVYAACDLAVCRAGAMTVAELTAAGVPAIFVPLPGAPGDHQGANARAVVAGGGARLVPDGECCAERLEAEIAELTADPGTLPAMARASRRLGRPQAALAVAAVAEAHARPGATTSKRPGGATR